MPWFKILLLVLASFFSSLSYAQIQRKILFGNYASVVNEPVAYLQTVYLEAGKVGHCSGAVIGKKTILTANHCLPASRNQPVHAYVGGKAYAIKKRYGGPFDLALLATTKRISSRRYKIAKNFVPGIGQLVAVIGYGMPEVGLRSFGTLKYTYMTVIGYEGSGFFWTGSIDGSTACQGDSGGPAVVTYRGRQTVIGVVSRGAILSDCAIGDSTAFGATGSTRGYKWITNTLKKTEK